MKNLLGSVDIIDEAKVYEERTKSLTAYITSQLCVTLNAK